PLKGHPYYLFRSQRTDLLWAVRAGACGNQLRHSRHGFQQQRGAGRHLAFEAIGRARGDLGGFQRIAAEIQEIVVDTQLLDAEDFFPDCDQVVFDRVPGRLKRPVTIAANWYRWWVSMALD